MTQLSFDIIPLSGDAKLVYDLVERWGEISFTDLVFQLGWKRERAAIAFNSLLRKGKLRSTGENIGWGYCTDARYQDLYAGDEA